MTGCHEHNSSPSVAGRGGDGANQWFTHSRTRCSKKYFTHRWHLWARWSYSGFAQAATVIRSHDIFRQRFGCDSSSTADQRSSPTDCARQLCTNGSVRRARISRWNFVGLGDQLTSSGRGTSWIFISPRRSFGHAYEYRAWFNGRTVVRASASRGNHARD